MLLCRCSKDRTTPAQDWMSNQMAGPEPYPDEPRFIGVVVGFLVFALLEILNRGLARRPGWSSIPDDRTDVRQTAASALADDGTAHRKARAPHATRSTSTPR